MNSISAKNSMKMTYIQRRRGYLLETFSKHLKPIDYDRWARLYWKAQLESITVDEERELRKLEKENLKIIEEVYRALVSDSEVQALIEKIKGHEWVRVVEK